MSGSALKINDSTRQCLNTVARLKFVTRDQLLFWSPLNDLSSITRITNDLVKKGLLFCVDDLCPNVFCLTQTGYRYCGFAYQARRYSMPAIQQCAHRNAAEITLRDKDDSVSVQSRKYCLRYGFFPSKAEYLLHARDGFSLLLVDDYAMAPSRIAHALSRAHTPDKRFYDLDASHPIRHWKDVVDTVYVFTTYRDSVIRHQAYIAEQGIVGSVHFIKPIWKVA
ncbi:MAG: hypothetical protein OQK73_00175 [Gammaproteobacteria bacterium]|nr:hypothetical protein [Gammaproteobacteria bacterium]